VPRWYHLFWDRESEALCIRVHRFFLDNCEYKNFESYFKGLYDNPSYLPLFDRYEPRLGQEFFGINDSIKLIDQDDDWLTYQVKIPSVIQKTNVACRRYAGTGRRYPRDLDLLSFWCSFNHSSRSPQRCWIYKYHKQKKHF
jgi:hypothetical protein